MDHKEKLELARDWYNDQFTTNKEKLLLETLFSELKESEDERIRKELIGMVKFHCADEYLDRYLNWLEKQGEKSIIIDVDQMVTDYSYTKDGEFGLPVNCMIRAYRKGINDVLKLSLNFEKQVEQKPTWSEEDELMLKDAIEFIETGWSGNGKSHLVYWLKSLKDRFTWKPNVQQLTAFAQHLQKRGAFCDDLCMDFEHEAQSFIEFQKFTSKTK